MPHDQRNPQPGEIWETLSGCLVEVMFLSEMVGGPTPLVTYRHYPSDGSRGLMTDTLEGWRKHCRELQRLHPWQFYSMAWE